jgi:hypothetical protein
VVQHLWGNVVRGSDGLIQLLVGLELQCSSEVNNFDLIKLLAGLKQDILGLQITMDDVVTVAIRYTG